MLSRVVSTPMKEFHNMLTSVTMSPCYDQMIRFSAPLKHYFGINHFWYYRVTNSGLYSYMGSHLPWSEYCFEHHLVDQFPCLRQPDKLPTGISLMKNSEDCGYKEVLKLAWEKFNINFSINLTNKTSNGIEAFGFATKYSQPESDDHLLKELPLLQHFTKLIRKKYHRLFNVLENNQVDFSSYLGDKWNDTLHHSLDHKKREAFLEKMGFLPKEALTLREKSVIELLANGYPASYIAKKLNLATRTVENYTATIKEKLWCESKVELIHKAQELKNIGYLL